MSLNIEIDFFEWSYNFTPYKFIEILETYCESSGLELETGESIYKTFSKPIEDVKIGSLIRDFLTLSREVIEIAWAVAQGSSKRSLNLSFDFPPHLKSACEQYLIYFGQFLADAGQRAEVNLSHSSEATLFEVVPKDRDASLEKIREALNAYLAASTSQPSTALDLSLAESRFQSVIAGLQAQVMSLQAQENAYQLERKSTQMIMAQQAQVIAAQATALAQANSSINIFAASLHASDGEEENLLGDVVRVKAYEKGPFKLDGAAALRHVKGLFSQGSEDTE